MRIPLTLMPMDAYINERLTHRMIQGAYFGLMLVIALASLVIFFSIRDRTYLYYFGFILTTGLWFSSARALPSSISGLTGPGGAIGPISS